MLVDDVPVLQYLLSHPRRQAGLIAAGNQEVSFTEFEVSGGAPRAFVVTQFAEPYDTFYRDDTFYREVIKKKGGGERI